MNYAATLPYTPTWEGPFAISEESTIINTIIKKKFKEFFNHDLESISIQRSVPAVKFTILKTEWESETALFSSVTDIALHPAYQQIIGMGKDVIPLMLAELKRKPGHWFWALKAITGEDPVLPEQRGLIKEMTAAWLRWGHRQGYRV